MTPEEIHRIFQSTINEGELYDARLKQALLDRFEWNTLDASSGALAWVTLAGRAMNTYARQYGECFQRTVGDRLTLALMLSQYYAVHLEEFTPQARRDAAKRLGLPRLEV